MIFQVQSINQYRNNQLKSNKIYKNFLTIVSVFLIMYFMYFDIHYINKFINDKDFKEKTIKNVKDNLWWRLILITIFIIYVYYMNFVYWKWTPKAKQLYFQNSFVNMGFAIIFILHIMIYFILDINFFNRYRDL
jgi:hypothetical protein